MFKKLLLAASVFLLTLFISAAPISANDKEVLFIDGNVQRLFSVQDGLLSTSTLAIAQTTDGFIWLGGYGGLMRYDGDVMVPITTSLLSGVADLLDDPDGSLWIASTEGGIFRMEHGILSPIPFEGDSSLEVSCLERTSSGTIYFGTQDGIGYIDEEGLAQKLHIPALEGRYIRDLEAIGDKGLLCICRDGRLYKYTDQECEQIHLQEKNLIRCAQLDRGRQSIWLGTDTNSIIQCSLDFSKQEVLPVRGLKSINALGLGEKSELWICADNGIAVYLNGEIRIQRLKLNNSVDRMMQDSQGNYWFISSRQGVLEVSPCRFRNISQIAGMSDIVVNALVEKDGYLYIGHDEGIQILDINNYTLVQDANFDLLDGIRIRALYADNKNNLWVATTGEGLWCLQDDSVWTIYDMDNSPALASNKLRCIYPYGDDIVVGTDIGAYLVSDGKVQSLLEYPDDVNCRILGIYSQGDTLYLGTDGYGLYTVKDGIVTSHVSPEDGLGSSSLMKFLESQQRPGGLWLVTGNALVFYDGEGNFYPKLGLPTKNPLDILILHDGTCLIPSGIGLISISEEDLLADNYDAMTVYKPADGLPFEITANSSQCRSKDEIYFCGTGGVLSLMEETDYREEHQWHLVLDSIRTDGTDYFVQDMGHFTMDADTNRIEIGAHNLTYRNDNPTMFYYLEGLETKPNVSPLDSLSVITYTNLTYGDYLFHYGVLGTDGNVEAEITFGLSKPPHWYQKLPFKLAMMVAFAVGIGLLVTLIANIRVKRIDQERRIAFEIEENRRLGEIAYRDFLTGLLNRNYFERWMTLILPKAPSPIACISIDVNNLKVINDCFGHKEGDELLVKMAELLKQEFSTEQDTVFRTGGDEFLILACGNDRKKAVERLTILQQKAAKIYIESYPITFGYGICVKPTKDFVFEEALRISDLELLAAKAEYHGRTTLNSDEKQLLAKRDESQADS